MKKNIKHITISKEQQFNLHKPLYNGYGIGYGAHGDVKYNRRTNKRETQKIIYKQLYDND